MESRWRERQAATRTLNQTRHECPDPVSRLSSWRNFCKRAGAVCGGQLRGSSTRSRPVTRRQRFRRARRALVSEASPASSCTGRLAGPEPTNRAGPTRGVAAPGAAAAGPLRPPRPAHPSPSARPRRGPTRAPPRDPHPGAADASAAAGGAAPAETWPREGRGAARRRAGTLRKQPVRGASVPGNRPSCSPCPQPPSGRAAPTARPGSSPPTTGARQLSESEFEAVSLVETQVRDLEDNLRPEARHTSFRRKWRGQGSDPRPVPPNLSGCGRGHPRPAPPRPRWGVARRPEAALAEPPGGVGAEAACRKPHGR